MKPKCAEKKCKTPNISNVAKFRHSMQKHQNQGTISGTLCRQQVCHSHCEVSCPKTFHSSKIATMWSSSDTLLLSATSRPSSSSSRALSAPAPPPPQFGCYTLMCGCCGPRLAAGFGFLGAGLAMGAPCLRGGGGGGAPGCATGFPGLGLGLGLGFGGRVICITLWISTFRCPAIVDGGTV